MQIITLITQTRYTAMGIDKAYNLLSEKLLSWFHTAIKMIPNLIAAILIFIVFYVIGWIIRKLVSKTLQRITKNQAVVNLLETISGVVIAGIGFFFALGVLQLDGAVTTLLAGAGVVGLALGFAFRDSIANIISGIILSFRHPFIIGDLIECKGYFGHVHKINLRCTIIRNPQGYLSHIPNKDMLGNPFNNYTWNHQRRVDLECGVSKADDLEKVKTVAIEAVKSIDNYNSDRAVELYFTEFADSSMKFVVRFWVHYHKNADWYAGRSSAIMAIRKQFDINNISTPFPIRTLDFGMKGGEKLEETLVGADAAINSNAN